MSEDTSQDMPEARSFEERVFARFDAMDARFDSLDKRLNMLEEKVERRLQETRPIWEAVQNKLEQLDEKFGRLNEKFDLILSDLYDMRANVKSLGKRMTNLENTDSQ
jgi:chromosome segregation ATPase